MSRATAWTESAGIPTVGVVCEGFAGTMRVVSTAEGLTDVRMLSYPPPNVGVQNAAQIYAGAEGLVDELVDRLTKPIDEAKQQTGARAEGRPEDIVFRGDLDDVNDYFRRKVWSDGLPIMPPTVDAVQAMLRFTDRPPDEVIGTLRPQRLAVTVWTVAVNGVMAGCRPEYMPVLLAIAEAVADPRFGGEHVGSTAGWTPLIILNGPIGKELGFNSGQGVLRPEAQANITVARFLRLLLVNVAGYRLGETDMATFGRNYHPVIAEAEDDSPWPPLSEDRGFAPGANIVTVQSADGISHPFLSEDPAENHLDVIVGEMIRELSGSMLVPMEQFGGRVTPVLGLTPLVAGVLADAGYSKDDVRRYIYKNAMIPARVFDHWLDRYERGLNLKESVKRGRLPARFAASDDPERMVPVLHAPDEIMIVVCGSPTRNRSFISAQLGDQGLDVSKEIRRPTRA